jgi:hypothetical protein
MPRPAAPWWKPLGVWGGLVADLHRPDHTGKTRPGADGLTNPQPSTLNDEPIFGAEARSLAALGQRALARWLE